MRSLAILIVILIIAGTLFFFGNMMRCISATGGACPGMCLEKVVDCNGDTGAICDTKKVCRAPIPKEYWGMIDNYLQDLKYSM